MPRFLTVDELYTRRGQAEMLRLAGVVDGGPNLERVIASIDSAEAEASSYLTSRYPLDQLPAAPGEAPGVLKDMVAALAHRRLAGAGQVAPALESEATEARAWLSRVARGVANLNLGSQPQVDRGGAQVLVSQANPGTSLTFEILKGW